MKFVLAPDSFKGSLSAREAAEAMARGVLAVFPAADIVKAPIADGGEGTVEALVAATGGRIVSSTVVGPLGEALQAEWGVLGDGKTAVIEMAAASGLQHAPPGRRDPFKATSYGTGQLVRAALDHGVEKIIIGLGGSATNDGGAGMARALGVKFFDRRGRELEDGGAALERLAAVDAGGLDRRLAGVRVLAACDVDNPLCGAGGASAVYGPQKGATAAMVERLDRALLHYARLAQSQAACDFAAVPGAGAAGGLGFGLMLFAGAALRPGVDLILEAIDFAGKVKDADLVITGEGRTDFQTARGKAPVGAARAAGRFQAPTVCLSGGLGRGCDAVLEQGVAGLMSAAPGPASLDECLANAACYVEAAAARLCRLVLLGMNLRDRREGKRL